MASAISQAVQKYQDEILKTYNELHAMPEWGLEEYKTSAYLKTKLKERGITVRELTATGFIAEINGKEDGPCVGLRADIDALPFKNDAGETYYVHACGHDGHSTMGLWTMIILNELGLVKSGKVRAIFQPAEERLVGAKKMVDAGAGEGLDELYGVHIRPIQEARLGQAAPALWHGGSTIAEVVIKGRAAHGARPHLGVNAIDGAAMAILGINSLWANPAQQWSAKVTKIVGGGIANNIIPDKAVITLDMRAETNLLMDEMIDKVKAACAGGAAAVGATVEFKVLGSVPAAEYDQDAIDNLATAIEEVLGVNGLLAPIHSPGSDDFHEFKKANPNLKTAFLALGADAQPGLHDPHMTFAKEALFTGTEILAVALANRVG